MLYIHNTKPFFSFKEKYVNNIIIQRMRPKHVQTFKWTHERARQRYSQHNATSTLPAGGYLRDASPPRDTVPLSR